MRRALGVLWGVLFGVACGGSVQHERSTGSGGAAASTGNANTGGSASSAGDRSIGGATSGGAGGAGGADGSCRVVSDCGYVGSCNVCPDGSLACDVPSCKQGHCVISFTDCVFPPGTGGSAGAAGAAPFGGTAGIGEAGAAGAGGDTAVCDELRVQMGFALNQAKSCRYNQTDACKTVVQDQCGCDVTVSGDENSAATGQYLSSVRWLDTAHCQKLCPLPCQPQPPESCETNGLEVGVCTPN